MTTESAHTWIDVCVIGIGALPAVIAAVSSLLNGREQKRVRKELAEVNGKISPVKKASRTPHKPESKKDWYQPPDLN